MPYFERASHVAVNDSRFTDVAGDNITVNLNNDADSVFALLEKRNVPGAAYDSAERERESAAPCEEGTRERVIAEVSQWVGGDGDGADRAILWLHGPAGSGKTTIAHAIAEQCAGERVAASFFFSRNRAERSEITNFFPTLAYQLAASSPSTRSSMQEAFQNNTLALSSILSKTLENQIQNLILDHVSPLSASAVFVIDGLDECKDEDAVTLIRVLACADLEDRLPIRFILTSRPEDHIREAFELHSSGIRVLNLRNYQANGDIHAYFESRFAEIYAKKYRLMTGVRAPWPSDDKINQLVTKSEGLFIYASTLVKFVNGDKHDPRLPQERLEIAMKRHIGLDHLYDQVFSDAPHSRTDVFQQIIGALLVLTDPPTINQLATLLRIDAAKIILHLEGCRSVLNIPDDGDDNGDTIKFYHASLQDFLIDERRSGKYFIDLTAHHISILDGCIHVMTRVFSLPPEEQQREWVLSYACAHWYHHMARAVEADGGMARIKVYFGARLVGFLARMKSNWFGFWVGNEEDYGKICIVGDSVFRLASIMKKNIHTSRKLHDTFCGVLRALEKVCHLLIKTTRHLRTSLNRKK